MGSEGIQVYVYSVEAERHLAVCASRIYLMRPRPDETNAISNRLSDVYTVLRHLVHLIEF
jgi:hypothetical protein